MFVEEAKITTEEVEQLRRQLLRAQRLSSVGALASSVAHELNNILTVIYNNAKLGLRKKANDQDRLEALEKILKSGDQAGRIIRNMLGLARKSSETPIQMDLIELVENVLTLTEKDLMKYRVKVEKVYEGQPIAAVIPSQMEQVLINLILNARQAMTKGGTIRLEVAESCEEENLAEIRVSDTGCGIAPEKLRHIFDPFFTTKDPDEEGHGGTGLGLSICRQIIENHQGRIRVESQVGKGTTFTLKLPMSQLGCQ